MGKDRAEKVEKGSFGAELPVSQLGGGEEGGGQGEPPCTLKNLVT